MNTENIALVISKRPLLCSGLKHLIETEGLATVFTAADENSAASLFNDVSPDIVLIEHSDTKSSDVPKFLRCRDRPTRVIILGWNDNKLLDCFFQQEMEATVENIMKVIRAGNAY